ncbi:C40 family peptidase [Pseudoroseicyclus sp. H15]
MRAFTNASAYVGLPWLERGRTAAGVDCWGLAGLVYGLELGIELPSYAGDYVSPHELVELDRLISAGREDWLPVADPQPFDLLLFRRSHFDSHVGICVTPRAMLHATSTDCSKIVDPTGPRWAPRFTGAFRHPSMGV